MSPSVLSAPNEPVSQKSWCMCAFIRAWGNTTNYSDVIMGAMVSQITSGSIVCPTVCSGHDHRKHQRSAPLAFVRGIHWWLVNSPHKGPVTEKNVSIWWRHHGILNIASKSCRTADITLSYASCVELLLHMHFLQTAHNKYLAFYNKSFVWYFEYGDIYQCVQSCVDFHQMHKQSYSSWWVSES